MPAKKTTTKRKAPTKKTKDKPKVVLVSHEDRRFLGALLCVTDPKLTTPLEERVLWAAQDYHVDGDVLHQAAKQILDRYPSKSYNEDDLASATEAARVEERQLQSVWQTEFVRKVISAIDRRITEINDAVTDKWFTAKERFLMTGLQDLKTELEALTKNIAEE
jgi:hypothetical protein